MRSQQTTGPRPTVAAALAWALETKASALYADSAAQFLAAHLMERHPAARPLGRGAGLGDRRLTDVIDYMHAHVADAISLAELSTIARLSKHHFLRSFKTSTGVTPHQFLIELRMRRGAELLRTTNRTVSSVALQCGYRSGSHFAASFHDFHGCLPVEYRASARRR